jgi:glucose/arabinose dehydrogenase
MQGPVETRLANAPDQSPAYPEQTRAPLKAAGVAYKVETVATGLDHPWGLAFLPDGTKLVTERAGRLRIVGKDGKLSEAVTGLPAMDARGQGGLLGVTVDPDFARNGLIYWTFSEAGDGGNSTAAARGKLVQGPAPRVEGATAIWRQAPKMDSALHFGGRTGLRTGRQAVHHHRRALDPARPRAGPAPGRHPGQGDPHQRRRLDPLRQSLREDPGAKPEIWSLGHRNLQAAASTPAASCGPSSTARAAATS